MQGRRAQSFDIDVFTLRGREKNKQDPKMYFILKGRGQIYLEAKPICNNYIRQSDKSYL